MQGQRPHLRVNGTDFSSQVSTCKIHHTSHYWSMTVSTNCIRCFSIFFLHRLWHYCISGFW
uniref:Uncharacterized protein n=1 Tax=Anguilla anguilla TaxID=7936 RepID=A0A0E9WU24_ANGAN